MPVPPAMRRPPSAHTALRASPRRRSACGPDIGVPFRRPASAAPWSPGTPAALALPGGGARPTKMEAAGWDSCPRSSRFDVVAEQDALLADVQPSAEDDR